jgi:hypothetical protein
MENVLINSYAEIVANHDGKLIKLHLEGDLQGTMIRSHVNELISAGKNVALVDIDGTLRNCSERVKLLPNKHSLEAYADQPNLAYEEFHLACGIDTPLLRNIETVKNLHTAGYFIVLLTSCTALTDTIEATVNQMAKWNVPASTMIMRHPDNHHEPTPMKVNFVKALVEDSKNFKHILLVEDNKDTVKAFKDIGTQTLLVDYK